MPDWSIQATYILYGGVNTSEWHIGTEKRPGNLPKLLLQTGFRLVPSAPVQVLRDRERCYVWPQGDAVIVCSWSTCGEHPKELPICRMMNECVRGNLGRIGAWYYRISRYSALTKCTCHVTGEVRVPRIYGDILRAFSTKVKILARAVGCSLVAENKSFSFAPYFHNSTSRRGIIKWNWNKMFKSNKWKFKLILSSFFVLPGFLLVRLSLFRGGSVGVGGIFGGFGCFQCRQGRLGLLLGAWTWYMKMKLRVCAF